eukprot:scaffold8121_cov258-Pinguiococcus_pyrenoidosus.AAC.1
MEDPLYSMLGLCAACSIACSYVPPKFVYAKDVNSSAAVSPPRISRMSTVKRKWRRRPGGGIGGILIAMPSSAALPC